MAVTCKFGSNYIVVCDYLRLDVTQSDWHTLGMDDKDLTYIAGRAKEARLAKGWSKEKAAREAQVSSITYKRVEDGLSVQDAKLAAVTLALGIAKLASDEDLVSTGGEDAMSEWLSREMSDLTDDEREELWEKVRPIAETLKKAALANRRRGSTLGNMSGDGTPTGSSS